MPHPRARRTEGGVSWVSLIVALGCTMLLLFNASLLFTTSVPSKTNSDAAPLESRTSTTMNITEVKEPVSTPSTVATSTATSKPKPAAVTKTPAATTVAPITRKQPTKEACLEAYPPPSPVPEEPGSSSSDDESGDTTDEQAEDASSTDSEGSQQNDGPVEVTMVTETREAERMSSEEESQSSGKDIRLLYLISSWTSTGPRSNTQLSTALNAVLADVQGSKHAANTHVWVMNHDGSNNQEFLQARARIARNTTLAPYITFKTNTRDRKSDPNGGPPGASSFRVTLDYAYMLDTSYQVAEHVAVINDDYAVCSGTTKALHTLIDQTIGLKSNMVRFAPGLGGILLRDLDLEFVASYLQLAVMTKPLPDLLVEYGHVKGQELLTYLHLFTRPFTSKKCLTRSIGSSNGGAECFADMQTIPGLTTMDRPMANQCPSSTYWPCKSPTPRMQIQGVTYAVGRRPSQPARRQGGGARQNPQTNVMAPRPNLLTEAARAANRGQPKMTKPTLYDNASVKGAKSMIGDKGLSCDDVCEQWKMDCLPSDFHILNSCILLATAFRCDKCTASYGKDQPAADMSKGAVKCLWHEDINSPPVAPSCSAKHPLTARYCPCSPRAGDVLETESGEGGIDADSQIHVEGSSHTDTASDDEGSDASDVEKESSEKSSGESSGEESSGEESSGEESSGEESSGEESSGEDSSGEVQEDTTTPTRGAVSSPQESLHLMAPEST